MTARSGGNTGLALEEAHFRARVTGREHLADGVLLGRLPDSEAGEPEMVVADFVRGIRRTSFRFTPEVHDGTAGSVKQYAAPAGWSANGRPEECAAD